MFSEKFCIYLLNLKKMMLCLLFYIPMLNIIIVLCVLNFQCYRQVTHQINLEGICSLFESGGMEINTQLTVVQLGSTFLVFDKGKESGPTNVHSQPTHLHWSSLYLVVGWKCVIGA